MLATDTWAIEGFREQVVIAFALKEAYFDY